MSEVFSWAITFPRQEVSGLSRLGPRTLEISFATPVTDDEFINTWLLLRHNPVSNQRPAGWEPSDKSNPDDWQSA